MDFDDVITALEDLRHSDDEESKEVIAIAPVEVSEVPLVGVEVTGIDGEVAVLIGKPLSPAIPISVPPHDL